MTISAVVVIIAHKSNLSSHEKMSLRRCYNVLGSHHIVLICPTGLDVKDYKDINPWAIIEFIDPKWQSTYEMFNLLKVDSLLYKKFKKFTHLLYFELDAWVFEDELLKWCSKDFDYIGAPWFENNGVDYSKEKIFGVGNGGFSLRKISASLKVAKNIKMLQNLRMFWFKSHLQSLCKFDNLIWFLRSFFNIKSVNGLQEFLLFSSGHEDYIWCMEVPKYFNNFSIAPIEEAIQFSFEVNPAVLYQKNNFKLPFGCHGWLKYDLKFWNSFILENKL